MYVKNTQKYVVVRSSTLRVYASKCPLGPSTMLESADTWFPVTSFNIKPNLIYEKIDNHKFPLFLKEE